MKFLNALVIPVLLLLITGCETGHYGPPPVTGYPPPPPPSTYPPPQPTREYPPAPPPRESRAREPWVDVSITPPERQVIQNYVAGYSVQEKQSRKGKKQKSLPPGLQKKLDRGGSLPPGWERKLRKGEILPVEVYEQSHPLPREVMVSLPPQPPGTILIAIGGKVARILAATLEILDVFEVRY